MTKPDGFELHCSVEPLVLHDTGILKFEVEASALGPGSFGELHLLANLSNRFLRGFGIEDERSRAAEHYARALEAEAARVRDYAADPRNFWDRDA